MTLRLPLNGTLIIPCWKLDVEMEMLAEKLNIQNSTGNFQG